jgi:phosphoesterase RecJ-like protein
MAGLVIDTANFQHPNTTPRTLASRASCGRRRRAADDRSAHLPHQAQRAAAALRPGAGPLETSADGRLVWSVQSDDDLSAAAASPQMSEGLIDLLAQSESAEVAIVFKDLGDRVRMSVRTRDGGVDATELTGAFGGGGHARAAGASIDRPLSEARAAVLDLAERLLAALPAR